MKRISGYMVKYNCWKSVTFLTINASIKIKGVSTIKKIFFLIIIVLVVIAVIIFEPFRSEPYTPEVTANGSNIPTTQGSYCWEVILSAQCVDYIYTTPIEMAQKHNPTVVSPNEKITIDFKKEPNSGTLTVEQWMDENNIKTVELQNNSITVPEAKGIYVYHVLARWEKGDGNYAFSIEVK